MSRRAFTLLEMTVVVTVAGLVLAVAAPRFVSLRDSASVHSAMSDLGAAFSLARQSALARRAPVAVVFDTAAGTVELRSAGQVIRHRALETTYGIVLGANRDSAVYDPRGLGYGLSNLTVTVRRGSFVDTLTMSRLGRIRW
jgi:prepilin-type N-terminal cleavage/methylation domain-containing protein